MNDQHHTITQWIEQYSDALLGRALYMLSDKQEAQDMVQEVFLAAFVALDSFQNKSNPLTWLYAILHNKVADFYRKKYKKTIEPSHSDFFDQKGNWTDQSVLQPWDDSTDDALEDALHQCIEQLPPRWKIPVKSYYINQQKNEAVCQEMGITPTSLWKILQRSRLQLRACLEQKRLTL
ncbi:MAG: RNA polymerase sigma factor [Bacteroidota bacterium]|nr:RNA polymerase sigma factor [Bacteroidota bacterium]